MAIDTLTYAELGACLTISPMAARSLAKRLGLPRFLSDDGRALVRVDLAQLRHTPRAPGRREAGNVSLTAKIAAMQAEIARLEAIAGRNRADFERERERGDRLMVELLQANAETTAAKEATARLEGFLRNGGRMEDAINSLGPAARRPRNLAADLVAADRKATREQPTSGNSGLPGKS